MQRLGLAQDEKEVRASGLRTARERKTHHLIRYVPSALLAHACCVDIFTSGSSGFSAAAPDRFAGFPEFKDEASMEDVVRAMAEKEGYDEDDVQADLAVLKAKRVRKVGTLRVLSEDDIKDLGLPPVVMRYLLHVRTAVSS